MCVPVQKTLQDKELEGLQQKVQRLEKLCRALQIERNELSKKIQELGDGTNPPETSGGDGGDAVGGGEGASEEQEPRDSEEEGSPSPPVHTGASQPETEAANVPCPTACHCEPEPLAEVQMEACALAAQD